MDQDSSGDRGRGAQAQPAARPRPPDFGGSTAPALARTVRLVSGDFLLTVNPVDGSEIEPCPPGSGPPRPSGRTAEERAEPPRAAAPPVPPGPPGAAAARCWSAHEERERLVRLLARGRSVRRHRPLRLRPHAPCSTPSPPTAPTSRPTASYGSPATTAPPPTCCTSSSRPSTRPRSTGPTAPSCSRMVREIGAIVVLDDLEFGGAALDELLDATPECAFLLAATPDVAGPLRRLAPRRGLPRRPRPRRLRLDCWSAPSDRPLTEDEESNWAGDLWFESEGLPLRFVQAGALLRQCDRAARRPGRLRRRTASSEDGQATADRRRGRRPAEQPDVPLPSPRRGRRARRRCSPPG